MAAQRQTWGVVHEDITNSFQGAVSQNAGAKPDGAAAGLGHWVEWQPRVSPGCEVFARGVADTAPVHFLPSFRCSEALQ